MRSMSAAAGGQLELTRIYRRRAELRAGEELVGTLERQSWWRTHVLLMAADGRWMLRQAGWFSRDAVLTTAGEAGEREVGRYRARWRGDGTLTLTGGRELQLTRPRGWRMSRALCEGSSKLVGLRPHGIKGHVRVTVDPSARDDPLGSLLVLFTCQILVSDQAAMSATAAPT
jgi:hypothetical protein